MSAIPPGDAAPTAHSGPDPVSLASRDALRFLARAVSEVTGSAATNDLLFRMGRLLGDAEAARPGAGRTPEDRVRAGFARLGDLGLGEVRDAGIEVGGGQCRVVGSLFDSFEAARAPGQAKNGEACELTLGFLTGLTAAITGEDVVCTRLDCRSDSARGAYGFEVRPAHTGEGGAAAAAAPSGSTRFFLGSMGRPIGEGDISLDALLEKSTDAIILLDLEDVIQFWNLGAERMFQYARSEVVGRRAGFILPDDLLEQDELGWIRDRLARGQALENHLTRRIRKDGTELHVSLTRTLLQDSQGKAVGSTAVIRNVTRQKRTEEELQRAGTLAMVGELAAKIAHEVKNPLAGIYAAVQLLARGCSEDDPRREVLANVSREVHRLDETMQELLDFARPNPPKPRPTDLRCFVEALLESLRHQPRLADHRIEVAVEDELVVDCDARLLGQILSNLFLNAGQAMDSPGEIRIAARRGGARAHIEVSDTGPSVAADQLESIFEPFFTTRSRGTGLGLCIARKNVETHGGTLNARSTSGPGAIFDFSLPLAAGPRS